MRLVFLSFLATCCATPACSQKRLIYTAWADAAANVQLSKSALYFLGAGGHLEADLALRNARNSLMFTAGYIYFPRKSDGAFTAGITSLGAGYRYRSKRWFTAHAAVGLQYWRETMRINFPDRTVADLGQYVYPTATAGGGAYIRQRYALQLEYRPVLRTGSRAVVANHLLLSFGYTF